MFYFNPISYFFKSFIRIFTKKFFWVILILLLICIGWALYDKGVFAETDIIIDNSVFTEQVINEAKNRIGDTIWNDNDYDIWLTFWGTVYYSGNVAFNNNGNDINYGLCYSYFKYSDYSNSFDHFVINNINTNLNYYNKSFVNAYITTDNNTSVLHYIRNIYGSSNVMGNDTSTKSNIVETGSTIVNTKTLWLLPIRSHFDVYDTNNNLVLKANNFISPFIETESSSINNWSFDYLKINSGSEGYVYDNPITGTTSYAVVNLKYVYNGITYTQQISSGYITDWSTDNFIVEFPRTSLLSSVNIENGKSVDFYLEIKKDYVSDTIYSLGSYTFSLTSAEEEQIQQDSNKALQGEILGAQQDTNNKLDSIENTITDTTTPPDSDFDLPTIEVNDSTANFFDTLFTGIYNAFNTSEDTSISFTIFSKTITINSADFRMLNDSRFTILRNLLESSWYFAIGYMILKDIRHIFDKIKTGNIENAVSNDIKADMV